MALASRLSVPSGDQDEDPEDIFSSNLNTLFTDTAVNSHGWPGASIVYTSPLLGDIVLGIPGEPEVSESRTLFAHYLWNAALVTAEAIQAASLPDQKKKSAVETTGWSTVDWNRSYWDVRGCNILELGAGTALPSLVAALSGARQVTITDHPSSPAITTGTIAINVSTNITKRSKDASTSHPIPQVDTFGYLWGTTTFTPPPPPPPPPPPSPVPSSSSTATTLSQPQTQVQTRPERNSFTKIIIADCLWMPSKHASIIKTILTYLSLPTSSSPSPSPSQHQHQPQQPPPVSTLTPCALITAGFHTGRGIVNNFLHLATGTGPSSSETVAYDPVDETDPLRDEVRNTLKAVELFEIDVDGNKRAWEAVRVDEGRDQAKRWCVCAVLVRR